MKGATMLPRPSLCGWAAWSGLLVAPYFLTIGTAAAGIFTALGPLTYKRTTGDPVPVTTSFSVRNPAPEYTLQVRREGLAIAVITLNGTVVFGPSAFIANVTYLEAPVTLLATNELTVELLGRPGEISTAELVGVDNDPPTVSAQVSPSANANGWHATDATVTFICDDATSGVASCPAPLLVSAEGAGQTVSGTALDLAANSVSASVSQHREDPTHDRRNRFTVAQRGQLEQQRHHRQLCGERRSVRCGDRDGTDGDDRGPRPRNSGGVPRTSRATMPPPC